MSARDARSAVGRLLRLPLSLIPAASVLPVMGGPLRGMRWTVAAAPHGAWIGILERAKLRHFVERLRPAMRVWDIGANAGLYTLASARAVGAAGHIVAFEPMPRNLHFLRRHIALNGLTNVEVCDAAVSDTAGIVRMAAGDSPSEFHVAPEGAWAIRAVTLDGWRTESASRAPDLVKIDVEGAEGAVLRGGARLFAELRPTVYLALHGEDQRRECRQLLDRWGYRTTSLERGQTPETSCEWLAEPA